MGIRIREAKKGDLKEIAKILREEFAKAPYKEKWSEKRAFIRIENYYKYGGRIIVAEVNKKIIGFSIFYIEMWWDGLKAYLEELAVTKDYQGKGIGRLLIEETKKICKKKGVKYIDLLANRKSKAVGFYKKLGFKKSDWVEFEKVIK